MANINEILARAAALRDETALNSIDPERAGSIMYDTLIALNELWLQQGAALVISKIYASVAAMNADTSPVSDLTGQPLRPGQIVVIASSDSDNGSVYRYNGTSSPSWSAVGQMGSAAPIDSLDSDSTARPLAAHQGKVLDGKISQLQQDLSIFARETPWEGNIFYLSIEPKLFGDAKSFRAFIASGKTVFFLWAYPSFDSEVLDERVWEAQCELSSEKNGQLIPIIKNSDSTIVGYLSYKDWNSLSDDGGGVLLNNSSVLKFTKVTEETLNPFLSPLESKIDLEQFHVDSLQEKLQNVIKNEEILVYKKTQNLENCTFEFPFEGQGIVCIGAKGISFDFVEIPMCAQSGSAEATLLIGQTDLDNEDNVSILSDAISNSNLLVTKTVIISDEESYKKILLDEIVVVTKKNIAAAVISNTSIKIEASVKEDSTGLDAINVLYTSGAWYGYSGGASYAQYGAYPKFGIRSILKEDVDYLLSVNKQPVITLPSKIIAVVGDTLQLFYRGMMKLNNPYKNNILLQCVKGNQYPRYFQYTPVLADVGEIPFTIKIRQDDTIVRGSGSCLLKTVKINGSPSSAKQILCFGDSLTAGGEWVGEASRRLTASGGNPEGNNLVNINFRGSMGSGNAKYFGVGGWTWESYTTPGVTAYRFYVSGVTSILPNIIYTNNGTQFRVIEANITNGAGYILCQKYSGSNAPTASGTLVKANQSDPGDNEITFSSSELAPGNPLWDIQNNKMSFVRYANDYCDGVIDVVYVCLGTNELSPNKTDFSETMANVKTFADTLHSEFPDAKLKIMGCAGVSVNGGMGVEYGASGTSYADGYGIFLAMLNLNAAYQAFANDDDYSSFVEYVDIICQVDAEYNFPNREKSVNTRNSQTEIVGSNGVHPSIYGYYQIADSVFRNAVLELCQ